MSAPISPLPLISCLTLSENRLVYLKEAIRCYCDQTYPQCEMVIVSRGTPFYLAAIERYLDTLGRDDIRLIAARPGDFAGSHAQPVARSLPW